jgi:hypothetical protein
MARKSHLLSEAYNSETENSDYDSSEPEYDPDVIVWDVGYGEDEESASTATKKRTTGTKKRATRPSKRAPKAKPATGTKPAAKPKSESSKDASKKANSLIFGPEK